ncbi:MAG: monomeric [FeFe] hydrogenase [Bacteroidota bacterium]|nr:monomeric [FeFe] hydrogenase [Bacteroidota bacterium]
MTPNKNNASIIRRDLLVRISRIILEGNSQLANSIPIEIKPKTKDAWRCCVYKDRAVLKYKLMALLGYSELDETDELVPLSWYVDNSKAHDDFFLKLIPEACSNCPSAHYEVSNLCRSCEARPCQVNCPKNAISFRNGKAFIDNDACVNCGKCMKECPYNAIHFQARPCEAVCPVDAIVQDEFGNEYIDQKKCILCGKCMQACPFGAIIPSTALPQIIKDINNGNEVVALVAPSIAGQFREKLAKIYGSIIKLGFKELCEVAWGAEKTADYETRELHELLESKDSKPLMSSCCPAWVDFAQKSSFDYSRYISDTPSPLCYTAREARKKFPNAKLVFISPCIAKKQEAKLNVDVDYCISFEELGAYLVASGIEISEQKEYEAVLSGNKLAKNFAAAGGVAQSIKNTLNKEVNISFVQGLDKSNQRKIRQMLKKNEFDFLEVMSCEGGCLGGCQNITSLVEGDRIFQKK